MLTSALLQDRDRRTFTDLSDDRNLAAYVKADPVNFTDPLGLDAIDEDQELLCIGDGCSPDIIITGDPSSISFNIPAVVFPGSLGGDRLSSASFAGTGGGGGGPKPQAPKRKENKQCLARDGSIRNDPPGSLPKGNVVTFSLSGEGYAGVGFGFQVGGFYDRKTGNFGLFSSFEGGTGLGLSGGAMVGSTRSLGSLVGNYRVFGAGVGLIAGNYSQSMSGSPIGYSGGPSANLGWPLPVSGHVSRGNTSIITSTLPRCEK